MYIVYQWVIGQSCAYHEMQKQKIETEWYFQQRRRYVIVAIIYFYMYLEYCHSI